MRAVAKVQWILPSVRIALRFPGSDFPADRVDFVDSAAEGLFGHHVDLDLGPIEPTGVLGRAMALEFFRNPPCLVRRERFVEARSGVRVRVVHDQMDLSRLRKMDIDQFANAFDPGEFRTFR